MNCGILLGETLHADACGDVACNVSPHTRSLHIFLINKILKTLYEPHQCKRFI